MTPEEPTPIFDQTLARLGLRPETLYDSIARTLFAADLTDERLAAFVGDGSAS